MTRVFTAEQRAAIDDRSGPALLAANAGSGKTAVMVERFVEAVVADGVGVGNVLALTFTEKAAGELRERIRRRFGELGEHEHARTSEGASIGTIHGFCAGVLRAHPFAAGLDPRFTVLDQAAADRLRETAWGTAVEAWAAAEGAPALDLVAASRDELQVMVRTAYEELRSRGQKDPQLPQVSQASSDPDPAPLQRAKDAAAAILEAGPWGKTVQKGRDALQVAGDILDRPGVPLPSDLDPAKLGSGAKLLTDPACEAYRDAWTAYRQACADHHARPVVRLLSSLLTRFAATCEQLKHQRAAVDFEDLQLLVRDLFAKNDAIRNRWAERFALIMIDEFQDTNRLQLDVLERLERGNLFAVGDEFQSIYGFRHADVTIFRERAAALGRRRVRRLRANFRSRPALLETINAIFVPIFGDGFAPLVPGRAPEPAAPPEGRLFDPDHVGAVAGPPPVELLLTDTSQDWDAAPGLGLELPDEPAHRRAEARQVAERLKQEVDAGRRPGEIAVLVRAAASLRLLEQALEERGLATYVVGGRGYWSSEQVRDGLAYLQTLANPLDETALYAVLASPFAQVGADGLVLTAQAGRDQGGAWGALTGDTTWMAALGERDALERITRILQTERERAERLPAEVLLERAIAATGYDVAVLARPGGERRLANLRKLMRLARDFERAEGRDLRAFLAFAQTQDLTGAREGEAALESEGLDAVRLMTIHRAKGLEFNTVCIADLGRGGPGGADPIRLGRVGAGSIGIRLRALGAPVSVPALDYAALDADRTRREDEEERRLLYVAMTRAREHLILAGGYDLARRPQPRPGAAPMTWILPAVEPLLEPQLNDPAAVAAPAPPRGPAPAGTALPVPATLLPAAPTAPHAVPTTLSFTSLGAYGRCGYRWYLERVLRLPRVKPPPLDDPEPPRNLDLMARGSLVHTLLEDLDFASPATPEPDAVRAASRDVELTDDEVTDVQRLVDAFANSPLRARLDAAPVVRREAPFTFTLEPGTGGLLVNGVVDVLAVESDGGLLIVDYKTNPLDGTDPVTLTETDYGAQRLVYALAALRDGAERVEVAHCYLEDPAHPATATYTAADAARLNEELVGLAAGLLAGDFAVTEQPHRDLCGSCPGRRALCSHPEAATLSRL
ncbi:MAG: hypothetical protein QOF76_828 [Solirubrobacteraceae bacterium]|nr:hypothetical protein [Solirubrobacteraceae bacterium]